MKRYGYLYEQVCSYDNLVKAAENARKNKSRQQTIKDFYSDFETNIKNLERELRTQTFKTSAYSLFKIHEPKERLIYRLPFKDRIVQWSIMLTIEKIWTSYFTRDTYSCIKGKGIHGCLRKIKEDMRADPEGTKYCLKLDVKKFYPTINHSILKEVVRQKLKDPELNAVLDEVIDSVTEEEGVPIGNYLSQYFANLYLAELDHLIKEECRINYYYRYADDIVLLHSNKKELHGILVYINHYLNFERAMTIKTNFQVFSVKSRGVDFVGYVIYHTHVLARKQNKKGLIIAVKKLREKGATEEEMKQQLSGRLGFMKHCNSRHLLKSLDILNLIDMKKFSDIKKTPGKLEGDKIHINDILDRKIEVLAIEIGPSKHNQDKCLTIQYHIEEEVPQEDGSTKIEKVKHITFTGSKKLIEQLEPLEQEDFPFEAKIIKQPIQDGRKCFYKVVDPDD